MMRRPRFWRLAPALAGAAVAGLLAAASADAGGGAPLDLSRFEETFVEEFDSLDVSAWGEGGTRWIAHTPYNGDFGDARFADPAPGFPFTVEGGVLRIEARKFPDGKWRSGLLASVNAKGEGFSQPLGYFEARMKMPDGEGIWPAFWLLGVDRSKHVAEIDVVEHYGARPDRFHSVRHIWRGNRSEAKEHITTVPPGSLSEAFHTYGVEIGTDTVTYYFDRTPIWEHPKPAEFDMPFYVLVNLALGSGWPIENTKNPSFLHVDYVRAWKRLPGDVRADG